MPKASINCSIFSLFVSERINGGTLPPNGMLFEQTIDPTGAVSKPARACQRRDFIAKLRKLGFAGPFPGKRYLFFSPEGHRGLRFVVKQVIVIPTLQNLVLSEIEQTFVRQVLDRPVAEDLGPPDQRRRRRRPLRASGQF